MESQELEQWRARAMILSEKGSEYGYALEQLKRMDYGIMEFRSAASYLRKIKGTDALSIDCALEALDDARTAVMCAIIDLQKELIREC